MFKAPKHEAAAVSIPSDAPLMAYSMDLRDLNPELHGSTVEFDVPMTLLHGPVFTQEIAEQLRVCGLEDEEIERLADKTADLIQDALVVNFLKARVKPRSR